MKYSRYNNILIFKSILYRLISITVFGLIFGFKFAIYVGTLAFVIYFTYDYIFSKIFKIRAQNKGAVLWLTGLPCSGKSTLADGVAIYLKNHGFKTQRLDGDNVRCGGLSGDLGFSKEDRDKNIKRVTFVSRLLSNQQVIVLSSFVSPYRKTRQYVRESVKDFVEIYVKCSTEECIRRDVKGMWKLAKEGKIKGFTGYDDPYEIPNNPEICINTEIESIEESIQKIIKYLKKRGLI